MHIRRKATVEKSLNVSEVIDPWLIDTCVKGLLGFAQGTVGARQ